MNKTDWRLAVDIGGTFTDIVLLDAGSGRVVVEKTLTTPSAPLGGVRKGVMSALAKAGIAPGDITRPIVHATTLITNALIEGKTGRAALVTTQGFGDTLEIRTEHRYDMYDMQIEYPPSPIPRELVFELDERVMATGEVRREPAEAALDELAARMAGVEAVAVCLLNSYANAANEKTVAEGLAKRLGVPVCASYEVTPQIREYPRMITTACNAATMPVIGPYLEELERWLADEGFGASVLMMLSNGGVVSAADARKVPIRLVESGPAAGALAGVWYARRLGEDRLFCFDLGGTTAKSCLIEDYRPELTNEFEVARVYRFKKGSGYPCSVPSVDLVEIGAGGGSLARIDDLGLLKVGPDSAGADPGPVSYARGGTVPATTDADLVMGLLDPAYFLGGEMPLDLDRARAAFLPLAGGMGTTADQAALGVYEVINQNMAAAARMHAVERGIDLRGVSLIAFGGAGPVHACGVAALLEAPRVVFPVNAGVLSAFGTLVSPVRIDLARSMVRVLGAGVEGDRDALLDEMRDEGRRVLAAAGADVAKVQFRYGLDARYAGQGNEITVWAGEGGSWPGTLEETVELFHQAYERVYGLRIPALDVEVVTWRVAAWSDAPPFEVPALAPGDGTASPYSTRKARFRRGEEARDVPVYRRTELSAGARFAGPALIEERETTSVVPDGWTCEVAPDGSVIATREV
ncbi:hydantoinase/oxoprolinase family protein [Sinosporangium siamense]|uniref:Methylhydantoinase n=1 Tax=Sinosporangium siamense TaxID=1367973 RepID=A0A919V8T8_9ACTN|nr:hydantoinase/oxoprolinase family protein [Sinosporangium siamense]GII94591.1 methylhydantoinase [Sinosporangium siamense]